MDTSSPSANPPAPRGVVKLRMRRPDLENLPPLRLPAGYTLRHYGDGDEAAWLDLFRRIFADDLRSSVAPKTERDLREEFLSSPDWKPERMWFAIAPGGQPVGLAMARVTLPALSSAMMALMAVAVPLAIREARLADPAGFRMRLPAIAFLGGFYFFLVFGWGGWLA